MGTMVGNEPAKQRFLEASYVIREEAIGKTIKELRERRGYTLEALARASGFTKGYLSKVENSGKAPPVSTLLRIAHALGVDLDALFGQADAQPRISIVKAAEREHVGDEPGETGYLYESVTPRGAGSLMHPFVLLSSPGMVSVVSEHEGEEMLFQLKGTLRFHHGDQVFLLEEGDCLYFDSSVPHYGEALSEAETLMVAASDSGLPHVVPGQVSRPAKSRKRRTETPQG